MVILRSGITENGITEYYLVGLERYEDFDDVLNQLKFLEVKIVDTIDGIYSRIAILEKDRVAFKAIYHEDVGIYSFVIDQQSQETDDWLKQVLEQVVEGINN